MSSTNPIGSGATGSNGAASTDQLGSALNLTPSDFLQLITTQLQAQNPLQPTDPTQFLSQLEQMSEVSSMQGMQGSLSSLETSLQSSQMANGASILGQTVLAPTTTATLDTSGGSITGAVGTPSGAKAVTVNVTNAKGVLINTFQVAPSTSGLTNFTWNGTTSTGAAAPAGQYTIAATSSDGLTTTKLTPLVAAKVTSVTVDGSTQELDVTTENGTVPLSSVVSIL
ncbi:MAG TPA: FlgD immunoglobulin-like domain containing protein [Steroidobacteraceae bacterium]